MELDDGIIEVIDEPCAPPDDAPLPADEPLARIEVQLSRIAAVLENEIRLAPERQARSERRQDLAVLAVLALAWSAIIWVKTGNLLITSIGFVIACLATTAVVVTSREE